MLSFLGAAAATTAAIAAAAATAAAAAPDAAAVTPFFSFGPLNYRLQSTKTLNLTATNILPHEFLRSDSYLPS